MAAAELTHRHTTSAVLHGSNDIPSTPSTANNGHKLPSTSAPLGSPSVQATSARLEVHTFRLSADSRPKVHMLPMRPANTQQRL